MLGSSHSPFISLFDCLPERPARTRSPTAMSLVDMPDQAKVCREDGVLCGVAEVQSRRSFGRSSWDKQLIVLRPTGCLLIYKYYLLGVGAGTPELGRIVHLTALHTMAISMKRRSLAVELIGEGKKKVTRLRFEGELVPIWGAKLFLYKVSLPGLMHSMHEACMPLGFFVDKAKRKETKEAEEKKKEEEEKKNKKRPK